MMAELGGSGFQRLTGRMCHELTQVPMPRPVPALAKGDQTGLPPAAAGNDTLIAEPDPNLARQRPSTPPGSPPEGFEDFYRAHYRDLVRAAAIAGATLEEAEDAASQALTSMLQAWPLSGHLLRYARKAVVSNFIKEETRRSHRIARRLIERGYVPPHEEAQDERLTEWKDRDWLADLLSGLPSAQQEVMQYIAARLTREEIAMTLGKSSVAVGWSLHDARVHLAGLLTADGELRQPRRTTGPPPR
jgi:RNA polymerase sigma factor (sigma-70 family)